MNTVYVSRMEDYERALSDPCPDIHACRVMLIIVNHIMNNYVMLTSEGRDA